MFNLRYNNVGSIDCSYFMINKKELEFTLYYSDIKKIWPWHGLFYDNKSGCI